MKALWPNPGNGLKTQVFTTKANQSFVIQIRMQQKLVCLTIAPFEGDKDETHRAQQEEQIHSGTVGSSGIFEGGFGT